jgi:predicted ArsR family transcriptional regulator
MAESSRYDRDIHRFAYAGLDRLIHERARLSVLTALVSHPGGVLFTELKQQCALTDGNLNRHLQVLESAQLVMIEKTGEGGRSKTFCRISSAGRKQYVEYLATLEQVIRDAASAIGPGADESRADGMAEVQALP